MDNELKAIIESMKVDNKASVDAGRPEPHSSEDFERVVSEYNNKNVDDNVLTTNPSESSVAPGTTVQKDDDNGFLNKPIEDYETPVISLEEFSLFSEYEGEDVELQVSKLINEKLADRNITAKPTGLGDIVEVTLANGVTADIPLFSEWNTSGNVQLGTVDSPETSYENFMQFISQDINQQQADIYSKSGLIAEEDGSYDVTIEERPMAGGRRIVTGPIFSSASADEIEFLTKAIEQETMQAFTSISVDGLSIDYPGLEAQYNTFNLQNIGEDTKESVKRAIYEQVSKQFKEKDGTDRRNITYKEFSKIIGGNNSGLFYKTLTKLGIKQQVKNNRNSLSEIELNGDFIIEANDEMFNTLSPKKRKKKTIEDSLKLQYKLLDEALLSEDVTSQNAITLVIEGLNKDKKSNATETIVYGEYGYETVVNKSLNSYFFNTKGMTPYRAEKAVEAGSDAVSLLNFSLQGIKTAYPLLSEREALEKYYESKVVRYQQLKAEGDKLIIKLDRNKFENIKNLNVPSSEYYNLIKTFTDGSGFVQNSYSKDGTTIDISINDIFDAGLDARDFTGVFDLMKGIISDKDLDLLTQYETTKDNNEGERRALYELIYVNTDPASYDSEGLVGSFLRATKKAVMVDWLQMSALDSQKLMSGDFNERALKDHINTTISNYNAEFVGGIDPFTGARFEMINLTDAQIESLTRTFMEEVGEGVGAFTPMLIEMAGINVATGGILGYGQIGRVYQMFRTGNKFQKLTYHGFNVALEEAKMQVAFDMPVLGGTTFYTIGQLTANMSPFNNTRFAALNAIWHKVIKSGVVGASSAEAAHLSEEAYNSFVNDEDFMTQFNDMYPEFSGKEGEGARRVLINTVVFGITGFSHVKKADLMSSTFKKNLAQSLMKQNREMFPRMEGELKKGFGLNIPEPTKDMLENPEKYLTQKQLKKYQQNIEFGSLLEKSYMIDMTHFELNPTNPKFEQNLKRIKLDPINKSLRKEFGKDFKPIEVRFSENPADYSNPKNLAQFDPVTNTIMVRKSSFQVGNEMWNHEMTHALTHAHFKNRPAAKKHFLNKLKSSLMTLNLKVADGTPLAEAIEGVYKENVTLEEFSAYAVQILSNKTIYNQKNAPNVFISIKKQFNDMLGDYGFTPKIRNAQDVCDAVNDFATNPTNKKFKNLVEADIMRLETIVEKNNVIDLEIKGGRELGQDLLTLETTKSKKIKQTLDANGKLKQLKQISEELRSESEKSEIIKLTDLIEANRVDLIPINKEITLANGNIKNNEVNAKNITIYKEQVALKEQALKDSGLREELAKLKKEFPNGSTEITRVEIEILNFKDGHNSIALQRASNELYTNNEKLINEFVRDSFEAGGEITKDSYMSALNLEIALIQKSYDPLKNDNFGIYLRNTL